MLLINAYNLTSKCGIGYINTRSENFFRREGREKKKRRKNGFRREKTVKNKNKSRIEGNIKNIKRKLERSDRCFLSNFINRSKNIGIKI